MDFKVWRCFLIVSSAHWFLFATVSQAQPYPPPGQLPYHANYQPTMSYVPYGTASNYAGSPVLPQRNITYPGNTRYPSHIPPRYNGSYEGHSNRVEYRDDNQVNRNYGNRYFGRENYDGNRNGSRFGNREHTSNDDRSHGRDSIDHGRNGSRFGNTETRYKDDRNLGRDSYNGGRNSSRFGSRENGSKDSRNFGRDNSDGGRNVSRFSSRDDHYSGDRNRGRGDYDDGRNSSRFGDHDDRNRDDRDYGRDDHDAGRRNRNKYKHSRLIGQNGRYSGRFGGRHSGFGTDRGQYNRGDKFGRAQCEPIPSYIPGIKIDPAKYVAGSDTDSRRNIIGLTGTWFPYKLYLGFQYDGEFSFTNAITQLTILDDNRVMPGTNSPAITVALEQYERYSPENTLPATDCATLFALDHIGENGAIATFVVVKTESDPLGTNYIYSQSVLAVDYDVFLLSYQCSDDNADSGSACETSSFILSIRDPPSRLSSRQAASIDAKVNHALARYCITTADFFTFLTDRDAEPCPMTDPPNCIDGLKQAYMDSSST